MSFLDKLKALFGSAKPAEPTVEQPQQPAPEQPQQTTEQTQEQQ